MSTNIDWAKLTGQGRVKAPGIPWSDAEMKAIYEKGMTPDEVRAGMLEPKDREAEEGKEKPLERKTKPELVKQARSLGIEFDENVVTRGDLIEEIKQAEKSGETTPNIP